MEDQPSRTSTSSSHHPARGRQQSADAAAGPKACATCRLAHASCDREQPCGRCVRLGKTESCQPPPTRKRGRPPRNKVPPPDDQQPQQEQLHTGTLAVPPYGHHDRQPQPPPHTIITQAQTVANKRFRVRRKTADPATDLPGGDSQPPHASPAPAAGPQSSSASSSSPSSLSPAAEEDWASLWPPPAPPQPAAGPLPGHQRFAPRAQPAPAWTLSGQGQQGHQQEQGSQEEGLRSLLGLVVDQMREMRCENEYLRATQKETERRLARVEQDNEIKSRQLEKTESRLARVEADHQTKSRLLEQMRIELNDHVMAHRFDHVRLVAGSTTPRAEVEQFIAQTLPFLQEFDCSSLIIRDLQQPFYVAHMNEPETLDDLDTPVIVYMSPSMCELLGYDMLELHGARMTSICSPEPAYLAAFVRVVLMRPPTRVGQPFLSHGRLITKQGRDVHLSATHQFLYNQRRLAQWQIWQVKRVLGMGTDLAPVMRPVPSIMRDPTVRAHLLARLPHSLLFGCQGEVMPSAQRAPRQVQHHGFGSQHHLCHFHEARHLEPSFVTQHTSVAIADLTVEEEAAIMAAMTQHQPERPPGRQDAMTRAQASSDDADDYNDSEMDELMRVVGLPNESSVPFSRLVMGFNSSRLPPATPATLAERWMRY